MKTTKIKWINPIGGTLIVLPQTKAILWGGIEDNNGKDYNFACSFSDYTSVTKYKETAMIVLGDEPLMTGIIQKDKHLVLIVRWYYAERESDVIHLIEQTDFNHLHNRLTHKQIFLESANYVLFESVERFENVSEYLTFTIESGEYSIDTYEIKNETTAVLVDRVMITTHPLSVVSSSPHRN